MRLRSLIKMCVALCVLSGLVFLSMTATSCTHTGDRSFPDATSEAFIGISEVAILGPEFVELYNQTSQDVPLDGWTLCYYSANRSAWSDYVNMRSFPTEAAIGSHRYFLVGLDYSASDAYPETVDWITEARIRLSDISGCVALFGGEPSDENLVDAVGWGGACLGEGSSVQALAESRTLTRIHESSNQRFLVDSDDNDRNFVLCMPSPCTSQIAVHVSVESPPPEGDLYTSACWSILVTNVGENEIDCTFDAWGDLCLAPEVVPVSGTLQPGGQITFEVSADLSKGLRFYALDLETTGFSPSADEITEIAWARFERGIVTQTYATLVHPSENITPAQIRFACDWLGVGADELWGAPSLHEILPAVFSVLADQVVIVHSGRNFDQRFLQQWSDIAGEPVPISHWVDTMLEARRMYSEMQNHTLEFLAREFDLPMPTHRALADATTAGYLYWELLKQQGVYVRAGVTTEGHNGYVAVVELEVPVE